jgi:hypothetical protein
LIAELIIYTFLFHSFLILRGCYDETLPDVGWLFQVTFRVKDTVKLLRHIIGNKLFMVEGEALDKRNKRLLDEIGVAMENFDFCSSCNELGGKMSFCIGDVVLKIDWNTQKITLEKSE